MNIIISHTSMEPIYEQIVRQIRAKIIDGSLKEKEPLPSVRTLSRELKISALTVKKAYAIQKGRSGGLSDDELREMFLCILEDLK